LDLLYVFSDHGYEIEIFFELKKTLPAHERNYVVRELAGEWEVAPELLGNLT
jgi:hypothetical protein